VPLLERRAPGGAVGDPLQGHLVPSHMAPCRSIDPRKIVGVCWYGFERGTRAPGFIAQNRRVEMVTSWSPCGYMEANYPLHIWEIAGIIVD
jgi:hypothetical protein